MFFYGKHLFLAFFPDQVLICDGYIFDKNIFDVLIDLVMVLSDWLYVN